MEQQFYELLHKFRTGKATPEEQEFLLKYYDLFESDPDIIALLSDTEKEKLKTEINTSIWQNIDKEAKSRKKVVAIKTAMVRIAAAAVLVAGCTVSLLFLRNGPSQKKTTAALVHRQKPNRFINLPDGSTVILSAGSKLEYPLSFEAYTKREVYLEGEAFFDIKHNDLKPFIVHAGKLETTVLGTAFDVRALTGDKTITVTVTRGRVKVSNQTKLLGIVKPNEQIVYNRLESNSIQNKVDAKISVEWTGQDLLFEDVTVEQAVKILEQRFKIKVIFNDQLVKLKHFTTTFDKHEKLENVLQSICEFNDATYKYDVKKAIVTISSKSETN